MRLETDIKLHIFVILLEGRRTAVSQGDGGGWSITNQLFSSSPGGYIHPEQGDLSPATCQEALMNVIFMR